MLKKILLNISADLNRLEKIDSDSVFENLVQETLDASYDRYCHNLKLNYDYLLSRSTIKVLKTIKREQKKENRKI